MSTSGGSGGVDWTNLLNPAPTAIAIMGSMLLVTATKDVSLADAPPEGGYQHIKYPNSLRATMLQVPFLLRKADWTRMLFRAINLSSFVVGL